MKRIAISTVSALFVATSLYGTCEYEKSGALNISFKAYKTPLKIGVGGKFDTVKYSDNAKNASDLKTLLTGSSVKIDTASVNSNNATRDKKLVNFFFDTMVKKGIEAKIINVDEKNGVLTLNITMNGVSKEAQMKYVYEKDVVKAEGYIDLADFNALASLASINKACYELHQGKTWSDVAIGFEMPVIKSCK